MMALGVIGNTEVRLKWKRRVPSENMVSEVVATLNGICWLAILRLSDFRVDANHTRESEHVRGSQLAGRMFTTWMS